MSSFCLQITDSFNFSFSGAELKATQARPLRNSDTPELTVDRDSEQYASILQGNQICKALAPLIDGTKHIQALAKASGINPDIVKECVSHLEHFGFVRISACFQFTNRYIAGPQLALAPTSRENLLWKAVAESQNVKEVALGTEMGLKMGLHEYRQLVQKGENLGMLRRLHRHLVIKQDVQEPRLVQKIRDSGLTLFDEICLLTGFTEENLLAELEELKHRYSFDFYSFYL